MASPDKIDAIVKFLITVMEEIVVPDPDHASVAETFGIARVMNAQRRFEAPVEKAGVSLVNDQVVPADDSTVTPKKARAKKIAIPARKKKKTDDAEGEGGEVVGGTDEVGSAGGAARV